jgi:ABC-type nitrate/sulfonate/bicarbonate transport system permease component
MRRAHQFAERGRRPQLHRRRAFGPARSHVLVGLVSVVVMVVMYAAVAGLVARPDLVPPPRTVVATAIVLITGQPPGAGAGHLHPTGHVEHLVAEAMTIQGAFAVTLARVLFGLGVGTAIGVVLGVLMGSSRALGEYVHPVYVAARSIPPLALIMYVMLWFGHGEAHRLIPVVYAVAVTVVIPVWQGTRDVGAVWLAAARALGAPRMLVVRAVLLPAITPSVLSALRYALLTAWMTTVGVEMLMSENGVGRLIVGGGLWSSRTTIGVDPGAVIIAIVGVSAAGFVMDAAVRIASGHVAAWAKTR